MDDIKKEKNVIREKMVSNRNRITGTEYLFKNEAIRNTFNSLKLESCSQYFMSYVNVGNEVETIKIIENLIKEGKNVSVPLCIKNTQLLASQIFDLKELGPSQFGLLEPKAGYIRPIQPKNIDIVLVPGLAFDRGGNRLGYGKGYYDRFLTNLASDTLKIGLAYSLQIIGKVPTDCYDIPLDMIITEDEIIRP